MIISEKAYEENMFSKIIFFQISKRKEIKSYVQELSVLWKKWH